MPSIGAKTTAGLPSPNDSNATLTPSRSTKPDWSGYLARITTPGSGSPAEPAGWLADWAQPPPLHCSPVATRPQCPRPAFVGSGGPDAREPHLTTEDAMALDDTKLN